MGVALGSLIKECKEKIDLKKFKGEELGVDAYNILYQFITTIRGQDGQPLKNTEGRVTSHINGLLYRVTNLLKYGTNLSFVFDGKSNILKDETKEKRRDIRTKARKKYEKALKKGDAKNAKKYGRQSATLSKEIIEDSKEFIHNLGVNYINAPGEAEAQISYLVKNNFLDYCVSQDYDSFLFGSPNLLRNLNISGKRKVTGRNAYIDVYPYKIEAKCIFDTLNINREKLIWLSILLGTDFNKKVRRVGPKTGIKLVHKFNSFEKIEEHLKSKGREIPFDYKVIQDIFLNPNIDKDYNIKKGKFDLSKLKELLIEKYEFDKDRINNYLNKFIKKKEELDKQKTIDKWF